MDSHEIEKVFLIAHLFHRPYFNSYLTSSKNLCRILLLKHFPDFTYRYLIHFVIYIYLTTIRGKGD